MHRIVLLQPHTSCGAIPASGEAGRAGLPQESFFIAVGDS
jgi:hypothetical protein